MMHFRGSTSSQQIMRAAVSFTAASIRIIVPFSQTAQQMSAPRRSKMVFLLSTVSPFTNSRIVRMVLPF